MRSVVMLHDLTDELILGNRQVHCGDAVATIQLSWTVFYLSCYLILASNLLFASMNIFYRSGGKNAEKCYFKYYVLYLTWTQNITKLTNQQLLQDFQFSKSILIICSSRMIILTISLYSSSDTPKFGSNCEKSGTIFVEQLIFFKIMQIKIFIPMRRFKIRKKKTKKQKINKTTVFAK